MRFAGWNTLLSVPARVDTLVRFLSAGWLTDEEITVKHMRSFLFTLTLRVGQVAFIVGVWQMILSQFSPRPWDDAVVSYSLGCAFVCGLLGAMFEKTKDN